MAEETNIVLEHLRAIRAGVNETNERLGNIEPRMTLLEQHFALLVAQIPIVNDRMDAMQKRIERIERRLELSDA